MSGLPLSQRWLGPTMTSMVTLIQPSLPPQLAPQHAGLHGISYQDLLRRDDVKPAEAVAPDAAALNPTPMVSSLSVGLMIVGLVSLVVTAILFVVYYRLRKRAKASLFAKQNSINNGATYGLGIKASPIENTPRSKMSHSTMGSRRSHGSLPAKWKAVVKMPTIHLPRKPQSSMVIGTPQLCFAPGHVITALEEGALTPAGGFHGTQWKQGYQHSNPMAPRSASAGVNNNMHDLLPMPAIVASLTNQGFSNNAARQYKPSMNRRPMHGPGSAFAGIQALNSDHGVPLTTSRTEPSSAMQAAMDRWGIDDLPISSSEGSGSSGPIPSTASGSCASGLSVQSSSAHDGNGSRRNPGEDTSPRRPRRPTLSIIREGNESLGVSNPHDRKRSSHEGSEQVRRSNSMGPRDPTSLSLTSGGSGEGPGFGKASFETARGTIASAPNSVRKIHRIAAPSSEQFTASNQAGVAGPSNGSPRKKVLSAASGLIRSLAELPVLPSFTSMQFSSALPGADGAPTERKGADIDRQHIELSSSASKGRFGVETSAGTNSRRNSQAQNDNRHSEIFPSRPSSGIVASAALLATLVELGDLPTLPSLPSMKSVREGGVHSGLSAADLSTQADTSAAANSSFETTGPSVQDLSCSRSVPSSCTTMTTALDGDSRISFPQPPQPPPVPEKPVNTSTLPQILSPEMLASKSPFVSPFHKTVFPDRLDYDADEVALKEKKASIAPVLAVYLAENSTPNLLLRATDERGPNPLGTGLAHDLKHRASFAGTSLKARLKPSMSSIGSMAASSTYVGSPGNGDNSTVYT
ncbi:hypothetical protein CF319_g3055 [Tilletia indica]|nr:hypothetical protein CF319_g3055 [Tilletia indica]